MRVDVASGTSQPHFELTAPLLGLGGAILPAY